MSSLVSPFTQHPYVILMGIETCVQRSQLVTEVLCTVERTQKLLAITFRSDCDCRGLHFSLPGFKTLKAASF